MGGLTVDCNNRTHEGALQSETPFSAQTWYASGAVFMQLGKAMRARGFPARNTWVLTPEKNDAMVANFVATLETSGDDSFVPISYAPERVCSEQKINR